MLKMNSVSKIFDDGTRAVNDVSLEVKAGEFCVLLGSSGGGKSTLMGMINGVITPSSGELLFEGENINKRNIRKLQQRVSMIHQQLHLVPRFSVLNNVIAGILSKIPFWRVLLKIFSIQDQRRACMLLEEMGLEEHQIHRRASSLSGGQQQRVAIARAFMSDPDIVLADEPVASLDPATSRNVLNTLKNASVKRQTAVICSLHDVEFACEFADRIVALKSGEVVFNGSPNELTESLLSQIYINKKDRPVDKIAQSIADVRYG